MKTAPCLDRLGGARAQPFATSFLLNFSFQDRKSKAGGRQIGLALKWVQTARLPRAVFRPFPWRRQQDNRSGAGCWQLSRQTEKECLRWWNIQPRPYLQQRLVHKERSGGRPAPFPRRLGLRGRSSSSQARLCFSLLSLSSWLCSAPQFASAVCPVPQTSLPLLRGLAPWASLVAQRLRCSSVR